METFSRGTLSPEWVTGFSDAAASFTYSRSGKQVAVYFAVKAERRLLGDVQAFFAGAGTIYESPGASAYYRITHRDDLRRVLDHFDAYPLMSAKRGVYDLWRQMVLLKQEFRRPDRDQLDELANQISRYGR